LSKILRATCDEDGKVTAEGVEVEGTRVLSKGKQASLGVLLMDEDRQDYLTSSADDIEADIENEIDGLTSVKDALDKIGDILTNISVTLTSIGAGMTGPTTAPPPTLPTDVAQIVTDVAQITAKTAEIQSTIDALTDLKGALK
jgi:hypothetical protein